MISAWPSPKVSPKPAMRQDGGGAGKSAEATSEAPFMSQIAGVLLSVLSHRRSALPSPSKSAAPTIAHWAGGVVSMVLLMTLWPFISQICGWAVVFWNTRSDRPSLLKS